MNTKLRELLNQVQSTADFGYVAFESVNDENALGDNALHCVCVWGDLEAAKLLVENGIEINQRGEGGFTPLNIALDFNHRELADYLIANGANTGVIGAKEQFDREKYTLHMKCLTEGIEVLKQQIQEKCRSAQQGAPADVEPASRPLRG